MLMCTMAWRMYTCLYIHTIGDGGSSQLLYIFSWEIVNASHRSSERQKRRAKEGSTNRRRARNGGHRTRTKLRWPACIAFYTLFNFHCYLYRAVLIEPWQVSRLCQLTKKLALYIHTYVRMYICMYVHMYIYMYVHISVCMYMYLLVPSSLTLL